MMPSQPKIHLVRHAQGFHNLGHEFHSLHDPLLTPLGEEQCVKLQQDHFPAQRQKSLSLIAASPLRRTLHTAYITFGPALADANSKCGPEILAIPDAQETSDYPCDTGSDVPVLAAVAAERNWPVDISLLTDSWNIKTLNGRYSPASAAISARARDCRVLLRQKARELQQKGDENVEIVLVAHGGYMHYITNDWEEADTNSGTGWQNTEYRTYVFENTLTSDDDSEAFIVETMDSRKRRGKDYPMYGHEQQKMLYNQMMQGWEDQGLQNPSKITGDDAAKDKTGEKPADLERQITKAADAAEATDMNTLPASVKVNA